MKSAILAIVGLFVSGGFFYHPASAGQYQLGVIDSFSGSNIASAVIGNSGWYAYTNQDGSMTTANMVTGASTTTAVPASGSYALSAVSSTGEVVGTALFPNGTVQAFIGQGGSLQLQPFSVGPAGTFSSRATGVNAAGAVSEEFYSFSAGFIEGAVLKPNGAVSFLAANTYTFGINAAGTVAGATNANTSGQQTAVAWLNGDYADPPTNLGMPTGTGGASGFLNDNDRIVGNNFNTLGTSYLWVNGKTSVIPYGAGPIDSQGEILCDDYNNPGNFFLLKPDGSQNPVDIIGGIPAGSYSFSGINDAGDIIGSGDLNSNGDSYNFILTPVAVPEPASLSFLAVCGSALLLRRRRFR